MKDRFSDFARRFFGTPMFGLANGLLKFIDDLDARLTDLEATYVLSGPPIPASLRQRRFPGGKLARRRAARLRST